MSDPSPLLYWLTLAGGAGGWFLAHYLAPIGIEFLFETVGFVTGVLVGGALYASLRPGS